MSENEKLIINPNRRFLRPEKLLISSAAAAVTGQILNYYTQVLNDLDMDPQHMVHIAGVGCTARIPVYLKTDMFHGVHGRTLHGRPALNDDARHSSSPICGDGDIAHRRQPSSFTPREETSMSPSQWQITLTLQ